MAQAYPIEKIGPDSLTYASCSIPTSGNKGCKAWAKCTERTKGKFPVNVFLFDSRQNWVKFMHCSEWHSRYKVQGMAYYKRIKRPEKWPVLSAERKYPDRPQGQRGGLIRKALWKAPPPLELRGTIGSGYHRPVAKFDGLKLLKMGNVEVPKDSFDEWGEPEDINIDEATQKALDKMPEGTEMIEVAAPREPVAPIPVDVTKLSKPPKTRKQ